ncbi:hypothetical protein ACRTDL_04990 [Shewanella algae]|uniref:hypothetical protein n=1 Tax=Shewanella algae TaxID=38313 RepID=UPI003D7EE472
MDDIQSMLSKIQSEREAKIIDHKKHLESDEYQGSLRLLEVVTFDFIKGMKSCSMYCSRGADFRDNSLSLSHIDDYFMSAIMILTK